MIKLTLTNDDIVEKALDLFVQCVKFSVKDNLEDPYITLNMNMLCVIYGVTVPKHEINEQNIKDAWTQVIEQFGVMHMKGQKFNIQDGSRELTDEENQIIEASKG